MKYTVSFQRTAIALYFQNHLRVMDSATLTLQISASIIGPKKKDIFLSVIPMTGRFNIRSMLLSNGETSQVAQWSRICLPMQETCPVPGSRSSPEEDMAAHSSVLAWKSPRTEEPGGLQSVGSQRVRHNWVTEHTLSNVQSIIQVLQTITILSLYFFLIQYLMKKKGCA